MLVLFLWCLGCGDSSSDTVQNLPLQDAGHDADASADTAEDSAPDVPDGETQNPTDALLVPFGDLPEVETLPALLRSSEGVDIDSVEGWNTLRRAEVLRLMEWYAFGEAPAPPESTPRAEEIVRAEDAFGGTGTLRIVRVSMGPNPSVDVDLLIATPNDATGPVPLFLGPNFFGNHTLSDDPRIPLEDTWVPARAQGSAQNRATEASRGTSATRWPIQDILARGYGLASFYHGDIEPDRSAPLEGLRTLYPDHLGAHHWGTLAAWSWGMSRLVDVLREDPLIDAEKIAAVGHSRNGKVALWTAAQDPRIALVISNMSGCMGAALSRRRQGETLLFLNASFPHWFTPSFKDFNDRENKLPFDQHFLIALTAPRPTLIVSGETDLWADPEGEFLAGREASAVYNLWGEEGLLGEEWPETGLLLRGAVGYFKSPGGHDITPQSWSAFIDFADHHFTR